MCPAYLCCAVRVNMLLCVVCRFGLGVVERSASSPALSSTTLTDAGSGTTWTEAQSERTWSIPRSRTPLSGRPQGINLTLNPLSGNHSGTGHSLQLRLEAALRSVQVLLVTHSFIHSCMHASFRNETKRPCNDAKWLTFPSARWQVLSNNGLGMPYVD